MSSLTQYIELYKGNQEAINLHSAEVINRRRDDAFIALEGKKLPRKGDEGFEKTSIDTMMSPDFGVNINRVNIPVDIASSFKCDVPNMSTLMAVVVNDSFVPTTTLLNNLPKGITVDSLAAAANKYPDLVGRYYGTLAPIENPGVALNTMLVQDGVFIHVAKGVKMEKAIQLVNIFNAPSPLLGMRRVLIVAEEDTQLQLLICDHTQNNEHRYHSSQVIEIFAGMNSKIDIYDIEESSASTSRYSQLFARQESGANLLINGTTLYNGETRNDYNINVIGDGCETTLAGMAIGSGNQLIDNSSNIKHLSSHCHSNQLFKYVLDDNAVGAFEGAILVADGAKYNEAFQTNRNLLASRDARMHTKPQLEIYNDDVKCSHGATTGQLDNDALFYMRSRGIPEKEARMMLMQAFMVDVIDTVRLDGLNDRLRHLVEKRFYGQQAHCSDCGAACHEPKL